MISTTSEQDKSYEQLNNAIMNAITSSSEVKKALLNFQEKNLIDKMAALNLILSLQEMESLMKAEHTPK